MKRLVASIMTVSMAMLSITAHAERIQTLSEVQSQLAGQKLELAQFQTELKKTSTARRGWITLTVAAGVVSAIAALPGIFATYGGVQNMAKGVPFLGDPDNGGAFMIPVIIAGTAVSAGAGVGAYKSFQQVQLRSSDIKALQAKIEAKLADIEKAEQLIKSIN
jgi:hypothetical protein